MGIIYEKYWLWDALTSHATLSSLSSSYNGPMFADIAPTCWLGVVPAPAEGDDPPAPGVHRVLPLAGAGHRVVVVPLPVLLRHAGHRQCEDADTI